MDLIHRESHFNFIMIHLLRHFSDHIRQFGNMPIYSTEGEELPHKEHIQDRWRQSNKPSTGCQMVHCYTRQHAIRMALLKLKSLRHGGANLLADVLQHLESTTSAVTAPVVRRRILRARRDEVSNNLDFSNGVGGLLREYMSRIDLI